MKNKKKPVYEPFDRSQGLELMDSDCYCIQQDANEEDLEHMGLDALEALRDSLMDDIADYDTIIEIQLEEKRKSEELSNDRRRRQQLNVELRKVKKMIKMMKKENVKEYAVA